MGRARKSARAVSARLAPPIKARLSPPPNPLDCKNCAASACAAACPMYCTAGSASRCPGPARVASSLACRLVRSSARAVSLGHSMRWRFCAGGAVAGARAALVTSGAAAVGCGATPESARGLGSDGRSAGACAGSRSGSCSSPRSSPRSASGSASTCAPATLAAAARSAGCSRRSSAGSCCSCQAVAAGGGAPERRGGGDAQVAGGGDRGSAAEVSGGKSMNQRRALSGFDRERKNQ